jgi:hypothetical protein
MAKAKGYPGSKAANGAWQQIIQQVPKCRTFIEVFAGSAAVSTRLQGVLERVVNDVDLNVLNKIKDPDLKKFSMDYPDLFRLFSGDHTAVFYCDPPYLMETRSSKERLYRHDWDRLDHLNFLRLVTASTARIIISHYPCSLYDEVLANWRKVFYQSMTRGGVRTECLYINFPQPVLLADPSTVGKNFTDRQRIKRKVSRLTARLDREKELDRAAILSFLVDYYQPLTK